jgi:chromosome segregation protein
MFLKRLEISGFKSFANKTVLDFSAFPADGREEKIRGITAIVGPNGSGKSNTADALRWVMGEQSMKNLRGKKSEDIIFAGSGKKARLGSAHVTLILDNSDKRLPVEFSEVAITRKIFRSGESEYLINGSRVRLQDIVDMLAKAGVGKESYAIVNQGMADQVLNATPAERRTVIEDAAGVKQYQIKKERSLRKLESTRTNLEKVRSLTEEIKPHLKMLKRQAERASQSEGVARELIEKQARLFSYLWTNFQNEKNKFNEEKEEIGRQMNNCQREVDKLGDEMRAEAKVEKGENRQGELENQARERRTQLNQLERDLIVTEGRIELEKEKQKNMQMIEEIKIKSIPVDLKYVREGLDEIRREQEKLIDRIEHAESLEDLQEIKEFARVVQQKLHDLRSDVEKGKKEEKIEPAPKKSAPPVDTKVLEELRAKIAGLREEIKKVEEEIRGIDLEIQKERAFDRERRQKFFEVERKLRMKQEELNKLKDNFNEAKIALARVEVREDDLKNQVRTELKKEVETLELFSGQIDRYALEQDISKLKIKMEQIGGIDPLVIDEYNETSKRFDFLVSESADLENAITSLREIIKEMDVKIEKEFAATYEEINKEFTKYFRIIFGGGNAHLIKVKIESRKAKAKAAEAENGEAGGAEDDLGEEEGGQEKEEKQTGIDISACPPGKKIANLSMLSGGERSLTSLALLFAIISHNPPPFAVLDEVEAALDEANSKRFGRILQELSDSTQFVTITHNRETMRQASLLYGVTMGEDGISKLLSIRLDQVGAGGRIKE